jgi:hypothetical protein
LESAFGESSRWLNRLFAKKTQTLNAERRRKKEEKGPDERRGPLSQLFIQRSAFSVRPFYLPNEARGREEAATTNPPR